MSWRFAFLLRQRLKESLWVVPFLGAVLGPLLGLLTNWLDHTVRVPGRGSTRPPPPPGYPDETTALDAMDEAERLSGELIIQPDAIAAIVRNKQGKIRVTTNRHPVGRGATWGMLWGTLFGMLFFVPFLGMAVGAGLAALMGKVEKTGIDKQFQRQVRDMLQPGTSALFLVVEKVTPDKAVEAPNKFGGAVLKSSLSKEAEQELQQEYEEDQRFADTDQAPPAPASPPPAATGTGIADELERLKGLLDQGLPAPPRQVPNGLPTNTPATASGSSGHHVGARSKPSPLQVAPAPQRGKRIGGRRRSHPPEEASGNRRPVRAGAHPPIRVMSAGAVRGQMAPDRTAVAVVRPRDGVTWEEVLLMEEWAVAGLIGAVAGYSVRFWQEKMPNLVKGPAEAAVRTAGSAVSAGASTGGRAAGAALGAAASMGGRAAGATLRVATQRTSGKGGGKPLRRVPVTDGGQPAAARPRRSRPRQPRR